MDKFHIEQAPSLSTESLEIIRLFNESFKRLEDIKDFDPIIPNDRLRIKVTLDLVFSNIKKIEEKVGEKKGGEPQEVVGRIKGYIRALYSALYSASFNGNKESSEAREFYREINEIMEMIEKRGGRFVEDMEEYKKFNSDSHDTDKIAA